MLELELEQELELDVDLNGEFEMPTKDKRRAIRRKKDMSKANRKRNIIRNHGFEYYDNLHQYSKNKIHCSCELCKFGGIFNPNQKTHSDEMRLSSMNFSEQDYLNNTDELTA